MSCLQDMRNTTQRDNKTFIERIAIGTFIENKTTAITKFYKNKE